MARAARGDAAEPEVTEGEATRPRPMRPDGLEVDRWGLPLCGPARAAELGERTDPELDATGWTEMPVTDATPTPTPSEDN